MKCEGRPNTREALWAAMKSGLRQKPWSSPLPISEEPKDSTQHARTAFIRMLFQRH